MPKILQILLVTFSAIFVMVQSSDDVEMTLNEAIEAVEPFAAGCDPAPERSHLEEFLTNVEEPAYETKCLRYCLLKQFDLIKEDDTMNEEAILQIISMVFKDKEEEIKEIMQKCKNAPAGMTDNCEITQSTHNCMLREFKSRGYKIPELKQ